jgi:hypothetical protein
MICFVLNRFREEDALVQSGVDRLHAAYPASPVLLIDDRSPNFKRPENGGEWTHRYLKMAIGSGCSHIIKIDPDTTVLKAVENLPTQDCVFCRVREVKHGERIYRIPAGGALGFTLGMAQRIVAGQWMLDPRYRNSIEYGNYNDLMLMDVAWRNGLQMVDRPDFACGRRSKTDTSSFFHK